MWVDVIECIKGRLSCAVLWSLEDLREFGPELPNTFKPRLK